MATQGKKHMGGRRRYEKLDKAYDKAHGIKEGSKKDTDKGRSPLVVPTQMMKVQGKPAMSKMSDQPTRAMLGIKPRKGAK